MMTRDDSLSPEEASELLVEVITEVEAMKSLLLEVVSIIAQTDRQQVEALRDRTTLLLAKVTAGEIEVPVSHLSYERMIASKAEVIEAALAFVDDTGHPDGLPPLRSRLLH